MSEKVVSKILAKISQSDPMRDLFFQKILPSLRNPRICPIQSKSFYECKLCKDENNENCEEETSLKNCFTYFHTFTRHLGSKHRDVLPCNGNLFNIENFIKCTLCNREFKRKEHYLNHLETKIHKDKLAETNMASESSSSSSISSQVESSKKDLNDVMKTKSTPPTQSRSIQLTIHETLAKSQRKRQSQSLKDQESNRKRTKLRNKTNIDIEEEDLFNTWLASQNKDKDDKENNLLIKSCLKGSNASHKNKRVRINPITQCNVNIQRRISF